jgi:4-diphosphocytidyl-2-C-methyl-D-erythritol kinase
MKTKAYAKINWDLYIGGKRPDGFHAIDTVMVNVSLYDELTFEEASTISLTCSDPTLPTDGSNLVVKAAQRLKELSGFAGGARIHLEKKIPAGGGMGGGSSDAANTLLALNKFWNLNWPVEKLQPIAAELGSDIAFFLYGGWQRCRGRGEIVEMIPGASNFPVVSLLLVLPPLHCATPAVYKALKASPIAELAPGRTLTEVQADLQSSFAEIDRTGSALKLYNSLTKASREVEPKLIAVQKVLEEQYPGRWLMSGSGAVHFAIVTPGDDGLKLKAALQTQVDERVRVLPVNTCALL